MTVETAVGMMSTEDGRRGQETQVALEIGKYKETDIPLQPPERAWWGQLLVSAQWKLC